MPLDPSPSIEEESDEAFHLRIEGRMMNHLLPPVFSRLVWGVAKV
jgi:hypothetical protein